ncbi:MAG: T9SS type A sorting domain-containing protein [Siphonobacter aquaeclarae]|nr:T9SS type A sorting domain-containing protein [Siphonobacter aquaeclarae]
MTRFYLFRIALLWLLGSVAVVDTVSAQFTTVPISRAGTEKTARPGRTAALTLPFFDDFSGSGNGTPDPALWVGGGGTVVNNTMTVNHPTLNIASFDGLRRDGIPYNLDYDLAQGPTDTLTSLPIDLSASSIRDSLYLSFFWLTKGLGDQPDANDSLQVQFLTNGGLWQTVWSMKGGILPTEFQQAFIPIKSAIYLHAGFQFRFRTYGRQSGAFDAWHIDYVYLNKNRTRRDRYFRDISARQPVSPFLKHYRTMPLSHYRLNPAAETADTLTTSITNLNSNNDQTETFLELKEVKRNAVFFTGATAPGNVPATDYDDPKLPHPGFQQRAWLKPQPLTAFRDTSAVIRATFSYSMADKNNPVIPGVDFSRNNTITSETELANYFAYDDGSAEYAGGINQKFGIVAVRFVARKADTLRAVRIQTVFYRKDLSNQTFTLSIWGNANGKPSQTLIQQAFTVKYPDVPTGFAEFAFRNAIVVSDTFWVAFQQLSEDMLAIGLDKNTPQFRKHIYYNLGNAWAQNTDLEGAFLIRPVFGKGTLQVVTGVEELEEKDVQVFPNPTPGPIRWKRKELHTLQVYDLSGRLHWQKSGLTDPHADLSGLTPGMYLLRLSNEKQTFVRKLIIEK